MSIYDDITCIAILFKTIFVLSQCQNIGLAKHIILQHSKSPFMHISIYATVLFSKFDLDFKICI